MKRQALGLLLVLSFELSAQESSKLFQLWLPDISDKPFEQGKTLIEIPDKPIERLSILIRDAEKRQLRPTSYRVFVNGKGVGNVLDERRAEEGTLLIMEPENLRKRPDEIFDRNENAIEFLAESRTGRRYYQSWVVRAGDRQRNAFFTYTGRVAADYPNEVPPDIRIIAPREPITIEAGERSKKVLIHGTFSAGAELQINEKAVARSGPLTVGEFREEILWETGRTEIVVEAKSSKGHLRRVQIPVVVKEKALRIGLSGNRYAVVIGISRFGSGAQGPPGIPGAAAEAELFARNLKTRLGFKPENIRTLLDEKATVAQMRVAISDFLGRAGPSDVLILYIVTHGFHDPRPGKSENLYLASYETQINALEATALSFGDLERMLERNLQSNQSILFFDTAHELNEAWQFRGINLVSNHLLGLFGRTPGKTVFVSSSSNEVGLKNGAGASLLSHWLDRAAAGDADLNRDGIVSTREMFQFLGERIRLESKGAQNPRFEGDAKLLEAGLGQVSKVGTAGEVR